MFDFTRRINGVTYYAGLGVYVLIVIALSLLANMPMHSSVFNLAVGITILLFAIITTVYLVCIIRQRANDIGWHPLLLVLICVLTPLFLILGFIPGQKELNRYGSRPDRGVQLW